MGTSVTQAKRNTMVSPTSRMCNAISFGVFFRAAPSTRPIIRSRNDSPGSTVMRATMRSESTLVPPVTAERSPPLSRITGADSPVIADSSTEAMPSMTSPSPGMIWPASTMTRSPFFRREAGMMSSLEMPGTSSVGGQERTFRATVSCRILRKVSACALPRPSATASAKFANTTVNHSQMETASVNQVGAAPGEGAKTSRSQIAVVRTLPISTTTRTGFFATRCGASFLNDSRIAGRRIDGSRSESCFALGAISEDPSCSGREMLHDRAERERGKERERADDEDHRDEQTDEETAVRREGAGTRRSHLLVHHRSGDGDGRDHHQEAADEHVRPEGQVVEERVRVQSRERRAVVPRAAGECVEDLREAVRAGIAQGGGAVGHDQRPGRQGEDEQGEDEDVEHRQLHLARLDLLAQVLGGASDHQAGNEDGENHEDQHPVHSGADPAEDDLAELDVQQGHQTAQRREAVVHRVHRAAGSVGGDRGEERRGGKPEARLLALEVSAPLLELRQAVQGGIVVRLRPIEGDDTGD